MSSQGFSPTKKMGGSGSGGGGSSLLAPSKFNFGQNEPKELFTGLKASKLAGVSQGLGQGTGSGSENPFKSSVTSVFSCSTADTKDSNKSSGKSPVKTEEKKESKQDATKEENKVIKNPFLAVPKEKESDGSFVFGENLADRASNFPKEANKTEKEVLKEDSSKQGEFLFGQNLSARAENFSDIPPSTEEGKKLESDDKENGTGEKDETKTSENQEKSGKTLSENAAEYFENKTAPKRKYEEVEVTTGEENEYNVIQTRAKLYIFDNSNWVERGRGQLRLNDMSKDSVSDSESKKVSSSRIVMRTMGSLKVILNTKVYHGMTVEQPNEKSVRLTGLDETGAVKVFLVVTSPKDANALHKALMSRLMELKPVSGENNLASDEPQKDPVPDKDSVAVKRSKTDEGDSSEDRLK